MAVFSCVCVCMCVFLCVCVSVRKSVCGYLTDTVYMWNYTYMWFYIALRNFTDENLAYL